MIHTYHLIQQLRDQFSVTLICEALGISRSGYCRHLSGGQSSRQLADQILGERIQEIFWMHKRRYGARRIHRQLQYEDKPCGLRKVRGLMKRMSLHPLQKKRFVPKTTKSAPGTTPCQNLLLDYGEISSVNQVWVGDITYIPLVDAWAYLAVLMDLYSRRIIAWKLADHMRAELVIEVLRRAFRERGRHPGMISHSDQGCQYASQDHRELLASFGMRQSMSRQGNCYDNAFMESCFGSLKTEMLEDGVFESLEDAQAEIFDYIESYYNHQRLHSSLNYQTPAGYELNSAQ